VIDSQTVRAAHTVPTSSSGYDGGKKIKGRKRHVADGVFRITASLREALPMITLAWADAGYAGRFVRVRRLVRDYETLPATHEAMIWTGATWQLSNCLTR
jgi:hypothetical protein